MSQIYNFQAAHQSFALYKNRHTAITDYLSPGNHSPSPFSTVAQPPQFPMESSTCSRSSNEL